MMKYPVVIVEVGEDYMDEITRLSPVETLAQAKQAARDEGYTVIDYGTGGACETTDTWNHKEIVHVVTVLHL
jgi:hypothetical protein